jgi:sugar/nucleoside kinase (ribokinase family)
MQKLPARKSTARSRKLDVLGMGTMPLDILFTIDRFPQPGGKLDASSMIFQGGGPIPNVMVGLARFGMKTAIVTALGDDYAAEINLREIVKDGVCGDYIVAKKGQGSDTAIGFVETGSGRRTISLHRGTRLTPGDIETAQLPRVRLVHLDGRDLPACIKLARWAKSIGAVVTFDIGSIRNEVSAIFPLVDHLIVADSYAFPFTRTRTAQKAIARLAKYCSGTVVVTEGIRGSTGYEGGEFTMFGAYKVKNVDTTGAGDAFHTGYIYALLKGEPMIERLKLGAATAALKCTRPGARTGIPTLSQVRTYLKRKPPMYD